MYTLLCNIIPGMFLFFNFFQKNQCNRYNLTTKKIKHLVLEKSAYNILVFTSSFNSCLSLQEKRKITDRINTSLFIIIDLI